MALSPDGRYLFALVERLQIHHQAPPPGIVAADDDASFDEQVIAIFDTASRKFLDHLVTTQLGNPVAYKLLASPDSGHFDILVFHPEIKLLRWSTDFNGRDVPQIVADLGPDAQSPDDSLASYVIADPASHRHLLIRGDGIIMEARDGLKRIGTIPRVIASRRMYSPSITGDGKLLLIPTGPTRSEDRVAPPNYIDQIDTYDIASNLTRVRSLRLQRPILQIQPSLDGTELYALPEGGHSMLILDAATLWLKREYGLDLPFGGFTLVP